MTDKEKELLLKIKALVDQGVGGEKEAAEIKLKKLMEKLGISEDELNSNVNYWYNFKLKKDKFLYKLFFQILVNIYNVHENSPAFKNNTRYDIYVFLPTDVAVELEAKYEFYCNAFIEDLETFYEAFINSNNLWDCGSFLDENELTPEQIKKRNKALALSKGLDIHHYNKQLDYKR